MIGEFTYKGISASTFNLICKSVSRPLLPALRSTLTPLPGSSGVHDAGGVEYDLRNVTMKIQYLGTDFYELRSRSRQIAAWLGGGVWSELIIIGEEDKYYWGKIEEDVELDTLFEFGEADIPFVCQPFAYSVNDLTFSGPSPMAINNPGTRQIDFRSPNHARFDISFTGPGTFILNGKTLGYSGGGNVTIDNVNMKVINGSFNSLTDSIDTFLRMNPGSNHFAYVNATNVQVSIRPMYY